MIKFEKIQAGMTLYDCHKTKMGNTNLSRMGTWEVFVKEVYPEKRSALVSWNGNTPTVWNERRLTKLRAKKPLPKQSAATMGAGGQS